MILSGKVGRFAWGCGLCPIRTAGLLIDKEETVGFRVRRGGGDVGMMRGGEIGSQGSSSAGAVTPPSTKLATKMMSSEGFSTENSHTHNLLATGLVNQFGLNLRSFAQ